jgi:hypothetical protein
VTEGKYLFFDKESLRPYPNPSEAKPDTVVVATVTKTFLEKLGCKPEDSWPADSRGHCFDQPGYCRGGRCRVCAYLVEWGCLFDLGNIILMSC